jgi:hypothetical protein
VGKCTSSLRDNRWPVCAGRRYIDAPLLSQPMAEVLKDSLHRSRYLLNYVDSLRLRRNVQRALNRGESSINWYVP